MRKTVYLDLWLAFHFAVNYEILNLERVWLRRPAKRRGLLKGAAVGTLASLAVLFLPDGASAGLAAVAAAPVVLCAAFPARRPAGREILIYLFLGFFFAGFRAAVGAAGLDGLAARLKSVGGERRVLMGTAGWMFACLAGIHLLAAVTEKLLAERRARTGLLAVTLFAGGKEHTYMGLVDTGNLLRDPRSERPVHIISMQAVKALGDIPLRKVRYLSYRSIGKETGVMPVIVLDGMRFEDGRYVKNPLFALSRVPVSLDNRYQVLLNGEDESRSAQEGVTEI